MCVFDQWTRYCSVVFHLNLCVQFALTHYNTQYLKLCTWYKDRSWLKVKATGLRHTFTSWLFSFHHVYISEHHIQRKMSVIFFSFQLWNRLSVRIAAHTLHFYWFYMLFGRTKYISLNIYIKLQRCYTAILNSYT